MLSPLRHACSITSLHSPDIRRSHASLAMSTLQHRRISISLTPLPEDNHAVLTSMEQIAFAELPPISEADARRMRQLIWAHQGDLRDLL
jgi:hypothetical protein